VNIDLRGITSVRSYHSAIDHRCGGYNLFWCCKATGKNNVGNKLQGFDATNIAVQKISQAP